MKAFQRVWRIFQEFTRSAMFKTMGYSPFVQNRQIFDTCEFTFDRHKQSRKHSPIILEWFWRRFRDFGAISWSSKNGPCSKPWAIAHAFCSKSANFRHLGIYPKSTQKVAEAVINHFITVLKAFQRVWSDFQDFTKSAMFKTMGYSPFVQNRPIFNTWEFTLNRQKQSRKHSQIFLERFWRRFREFGAISRTCQNRPCSKPWAIAQAICSKSANFWHLRFHPKSKQTVAEAFANHFRTVLEAFQRVSNYFQQFKKSAMFKTMGYSPGPLLKIGQFSTVANSP